MNRAKAKAIFEAEDPSIFTHKELHQADEYLKLQALKVLKRKLLMTNMPRHLAGYIMLMARHHYGSVETDQLLTAMKCYPNWHRWQ